MPHLHRPDGTRLWYEVFGASDGEPILMIQGLGASSRGWIRQRRAFAKHYRCIAFDNRGVGHSDKPEGPYDLAEMAEDAAPFAFSDIENLIVDGIYVCVDVVSKLASHIRGDALD